MRNSSTLLLALLLVMVLTLPGASLACDRQVNISGVVFEWINPPARASSLIFHKEISPLGILKEDLPEGLELQPLADVKVSAYGQYKAETFYSNEVTDEEGKYRLMISLGYKTDTYDTTIEADSKGFMPIKRLIRDAGDNHYVTIILVREGAAAEPVEETEDSLEQ